MKNFRISRHFFLGSTILVASSLSSHYALAQTAPTVQDSSQVEEVVITAQKRTEKLEEVPVAAAVVGSTALEKSNVSDISDLNKLIPSVSLNGSINGRVPLGIRGVSSVSNESTVGIASGVAILLDGVPIPSDSIAGNELEDIQRVEVLKGPQATLGGRTAAQGVINIVTRTPSDTWTGSASGTITDDSEHRLNGFIAGPIVPGKLDFSVAGYGNTREYPITNAYYDTKTHQDTYGVHAKLLFKPTDNLDITLAGSLAADKSYGFNFAYAYISPGANFLGVPILPATLLLQGIHPSLSNEIYNSPVNSAGSHTYDNNASLNIDYQLGEFTVSSTTAFQHESQKNIQDLFAISSAGGPVYPSPYFFNYLTGGHVNYNDTQTQWEDVAQTSEELKLVSPADQPFNYIIGFFYSDTTINETEIRQFAGSPVNFSVAPDTSTYDIYARSTWKILDATSVVTGLRYNYDDLKYKLNQITNGGQGAFQSAGSDGSSALVGDISVQQQLAPNSMAYATFARGYAPKAYNTFATLSSNAPLTPVGKETIDHFEIGSKGTYFDRRVTLNAAAFDTVYHNYQIETYIVQAGSSLSQLNLQSAGEAETRGIEADAVINATKTLKVNLNAAYIDAKFNKFKNAACYSYATPTPSPCILVAGQPVQDVSGKPLPNSPKFKFVIGADQRLPQDLIPYDITLSGNYTYRTSAQMLYDQNPAAVLPSFGILDLSATIADQTGTYSATIFVNNVLDHHYPTDVEDFWNSPWMSNNVIAQPARDSNRYFGVRLNADF